MNNRCKAYRCIGPDKSNEAGFRFLVAAVPDCCRRGAIWRFAFCLGQGAGWFRLGPGISEATIKGHRTSRIMVAPKKLGGATDASANTLRECESASLSHHTSEQSVNHYLVPTANADTVQFTEAFEPAVQALNRVPSPVQSLPFGRLYHALVHLPVSRIRV